MRGCPGRRHPPRPPLAHGRPHGPNPHTTWSTQEGLPSRAQPPPHPTPRSEPNDTHEKQPHGAFRSNTCLAGRRHNLDDRCRDARRSGAERGVGGNPSGPAVLVHSGTPGSRHIFGPVLRDAEQRGIQVMNTTGAVTAARRTSRGAASPTAPRTSARSRRRSAWDGSGSGCFGRRAGCPRLRRPAARPRGGCRVAGRDGTLWRPGVGLLRRDGPGQRRGHPPLPR